MYQDNNIMYNYLDIQNYSRASTFEMLPVMLNNPVRILSTYLKPSIVKT